MKHVHFFGCSLTAGDELSDEEFFPWKKECSVQEYYSKRNELFMKDPFFHDSYVDSNKAKSYTSMFDINGFSFHNHAKNGSGIREIIFKILTVINQVGLDNISAIYMQIPPSLREEYIHTTGVDSLQLSSIGIKNDNNIENYIKTKLFSHDIVLHQTVNDLLDLVFINSYIKSVNIPFYMVILDDNLDIRFQDIKERTCNYQYLENLVLKNINRIDCRCRELLNSPKELGGHFSQAGHAIIANLVKKHILENKY